MAPKNRLPGPPLPIIHLQVAASRQNSNLWTNNNKVHEIRRRFWVFQLQLDRHQRSVSNKIWILRKSEKGLKLSRAFYGY